MAELVADHAVWVSHGRTVIDLANELFAPVDEAAWAVAVVRQACGEDEPGLAALDGDGSQGLREMVAGTLEGTAAAVNALLGVGAGMMATGAAYRDGEAELTALIGGGTPGAEMPRPRVEGYHLPDTSGAVASPDPVPPVVERGLGIITMFVAGCRPPDGSGRARQAIVEASVTMALALADAARELEGHRRSVAAANAGTTCEEFLLATRLLRGDAGEGGLLGLASGWLGIARVARTLQSEKDAEWRQLEYMCEFVVALWLTQVALGLLTGGLTDAGTIVETEAVGWGWLVRLRQGARLLYAVLRNPFAAGAVLGVAQGASSQLALEQEGLPHDYWEILGDGMMGLAMGAGIHGLEEWVVGAGRSELVARLAGMADDGPLSGAIGRPAAWLRGNRFLRSVDDLVRSRGWEWTGGRSWGAAAARFGVSFTGGMGALVLPQAVTGHLSLNGLEQDAEMAAGTAGLRAFPDLTRGRPVPQAADDLGAAPRSDPIRPDDSAAAFAGPQSRNRGAAAERQPSIAELLNRGRYSNVESSPIAADIGAPRDGQLTTHTSLLEFPATPVEPGRLDAIVVATARPEYLRDVGALAGGIDNTQLLVMSDDGQKTATYRVLSGLVPPDRVHVLEVAPAGRDGWLQSGAERYPGPRSEVIKPMNIAGKRNLGLISARMADWRTVAFVDDDILGLTAPAFERAAGLALDHGLAGFQVPEFPDNSVLMHAHRLVGGLQDVFVGGSALVVDAERNRAFFPSVYNEDWFFMHDSIAERPIAVAGRLFQRAYDPFGDPHRASQEEFGDLVAEGLVRLLHTGSPDEARSETFWRDEIARRNDFIDGIAGRLRDAPRHAPGLMAARVSVEFARRRLSRVSPQDCVSFVTGWREDQQVWQRRFDRLPIVSIQEATDLRSPAFGRVRRMFADTRLAAAGMESATGHVSIVELAGSDGPLGFGRVLLVVPTDVVQDRSPSGSSRTAAGDRRRATRADRDRYRRAPSRRHGSYRTP